MNAEQPYGMEHHAAYMAQGAYDPYGYSQKTNFMVHQGIKSKSKLLKQRSRTKDILAGNLILIISHWLFDKLII